MSLHLIIDGYNLIRTSLSLSRQESLGLQEGRKALLERLAAYKRIKALPITVVFDAAGGYNLLEKTERQAGVQVVFSSVGQTADDVIARLAEKKGTKALVVTSDRELAARVEKKGAAAVASEVFEDRMELAFYLETKGLEEEVEEAPGVICPAKKGPGKRKPKAVRQREARVRKI
ncbi:MAG: NYN domain-containing protein [Pseudomonadota bacterium]